MPENVKKSDWKPIAELVGIAAIVASLIYVGLEVRQSRQIAIMDQLGVVRQLVGDHNNLIIDNSDVWYRGCNGEELTESERVKFARLVDDYRELVFILYGRGNIGLYRGSSRFIDNYAANLHRYPHLRKSVETGDDWQFTPSQTNPDSDTAAGAFVGFREGVMTRLEELREIESDPNADPIRCGQL